VLRKDGRIEKKKGGEERGCGWIEEGEKEREMKDVRIEIEGWRGIKKKKEKEREREIDR